jgi:hypothetical protein
MEKFKIRFAIKGGFHAGKDMWRFVFIYLLTVLTLNAISCNFGNYNHVI